MKHLNRRQIAVLLGLLPLVACLLTTAACDLVDAERNRDLDEQLAIVLEDAGGGEAFTLPDGGDLAAIPQDPRNPITRAKVELGRLLFHETAMAVNPRREASRGTYSCATCHDAAAGFETSFRQAIGEGGRGFRRALDGRTVQGEYANADVDAQPIRTLAPLNGAWHDVSFWDGRFGAGGPNIGTEDRWEEGSAQAVNRLGYSGLESQAISALKTHRMSDGPAAIRSAFPAYRALFEAAFPDRAAADRVTRVTAGLAIAAYERTLIASEAPFQHWLRGSPGAMSDAEKRGAILFFGRAGCVACHSGPSLGSNTFHALGMGDLEPVVGHLDLADPVHFGRGRFTGRDEDRFRFRTPQLYNLADRPGFGHGATFLSVRAVVDYKNHAIPENRYVSRHRISPLFRPLGLTEEEVADLTQFLETSLRDPDLARYVPEELLSGNCFPANDPQSRRDLGCDSGGD